MARNKGLSSETRQPIHVLRNEGYSMWEIAKISYSAVYYSLHRTAWTGSNQNRKRSGRPRCTTEQEDKYIRVSSLRNRHLPSPQLADSLNSNRKTPVSTSTVKWRLQDAVADNGPLFYYVDIPFPATIDISNINNVYTVFLINVMSF
jgi:transposase